MAKLAGSRPTVPCSTLHGCIKLMNQIDVFLCTKLMHFSNEAEREGCFWSHRRCRVVRVTQLLCMSVLAPVLKPEVHTSLKQQIQRHDAPPQHALASCGFSVNRCLPIYVRCSAPCHPHLATGSMPTTSFSDMGVSCSAARGHRARNARHVGQ